MQAWWETFCKNNLTNPKVLTWFGHDIHLYLQFYLLIFHANSLLLFCSMTTISTCKSFYLASTEISSCKWCKVTMIFVDTFWNQDHKNAVSQYVIFHKFQIDQRLSIFSFFYFNQNNKTWGNPGKWNTRKTLRGHGGVHLCSDVLFQTKHQTYATDIHLAFNCPIQSTMFAEI